MKDSEKNEQKQNFKQISNLNQNKNSKSDVNPRSYVVEVAQDYKKNEEIRTPSNENTCRTDHKKNINQSLSKDLESSVSSSYSYTGFKNMGNSCYINATLQALMSLRSFVSDLGNSFLTNTSEIDLRSFYRALLAIADQSHQDDRKSALDPSRVKLSISKNVQLFANNLQQDAHEFLGSCLNQLEEDLYPYLNKYRKKQQADLLVHNPSNQIYKSIFDQKNQFFRTKDNTKYADRITMFCPSKRNFAGVLEQTTVCVNCGLKSFKLEPFRHISINIYKNKASNDYFEKRKWRDPPSIQNLLQSFFSSEKIEKKCDKCSSQKAKLKISLKQLPRVLIIHLKRFHFNIEKKDYEKLDWPVNLQTVLNVKGFVSTNVTGPIPFFDDLTMEERINDRIKSLQNEEEKIKKLESVENEQTKKFKQNQNKSFFSTKSESPNETSTKNYSELHDDLIEFYGTSQSKTNIASDSSDTESFDYNDLEPLERDMWNHLKSFPNSEYPNQPKLSDSTIPPSKKVDKIKIKTKIEIEIDPEENHSNKLQTNPNSIKKPCIKNEFDDDLIAPPHELPSDSYNYHIQAIIHHLGLSAVVGHYITDVCEITHKKNIWKSYNDAIVHEITEKEASEKTGSAYILFYTHEKTLNKIF